MLPSPYFPSYPTQATVGAVGPALNEVDQSGSESYLAWWFGLGLAGVFGMLPPITSVSALAGSQWLYQNATPKSALRSAGDGLWWGSVTSLAARVLAWGIQQNSG